MSRSTEISFRREETAREQVSLPAPLFNRCMLLLNHSSTAHVFAPIRNMQLQAVMNKDEIIFVDNHGYMVKDRHGGRLIVMAWQPPSGPRDTLNEPVPIDVIHYALDRHETHRRLISEFPRSLDQVEAKHKEGLAENLTATILPFTPQNR